MVFVEKLKTQVTELPFCQGRSQDYDIKGADQFINTI
jgi:hypothetical protein